MRRHSILLAAAMILAACAPQPDGTLRPFTHADGHAAVDRAFADLGPAALACAHGVAARESNHWPYAGWGRKYKGMFQMHDGFAGSYQAGAALLAQAGEPGHFASPHDPYVQALAARIAYDAAGGSWRANWPQTVPGGCP